MNDVLIKERKGKYEIKRYREDGYVKMKAGIGVTLQQPRDIRGP
jgi:hypothetical protein